MSFPVRGVADAQEQGGQFLEGAFRVGSWRVDPELNRITGPAGETAMEPKAIAVLAYLAAHPGKVVSAEELVRIIWHGRPMGDNPVYRCISQLRRALGDDPRQPKYIATVTTKGYRLVASVEPPDPEPATTAPDEATERLQTLPSRSSPNWPARNTAALLLLAALAVAILILLLSGYWPRSEERDTIVRESGRPTLAVLPFESATASMEEEYLADGIAESILNRLAGFGQIGVIARTSSFAFKGSDFDVPRIANLLNVQYILRGQLSREGDSLRIAAELVNRQGAPMWQGSFLQAGGDGEFAVRDEIATAVVTQVAPQLLPLPADTAQSGFDAYQHYLMGHEAMIRRPEGFARFARERFDQAIAVNPLFAEAYAERAVAIMFEAEPLLAGERAEWLDSVWQDIDRALELNPNSAQVHAASGLAIQLNEPPDYTAAETSLRRALALDPYLVNAWNWLSNVLEGQGRIGEAVEARQFAARIDPLAPTIGVNLARSEAESGQFEAAEARLRRLMEVPQPARLVTISLIELYLQLGRFPEALDLARERVLRSIEDGEPAPEALGYLAWIHSMMGQWGRSDYWLDHAEESTASPALLQLDRLLDGLHFDHPERALAARRFREILAAERLTLADLPLLWRAKYGALLSLNGNHRQALEILDQSPEIMELSPVLPDENQLDALHALAWSLQQTGQNRRAASLLADLQEVFGRYSDAGRLKLGGPLTLWARNELLLGHRGRALDLLERAERMGWRDYYYVANDPRWAVVGDDPRFKTVLAGVKASVDRMREQIDATAPEQDFVDQFDAAMLIATRAASVRDR